MKTEKDSLNEDKESLASLLKKIVTYKLKEIELWELIFPFILGVVIGLVF